MILWMVRIVLNKNLSLRKHRNLQSIKGREGQCSHSNVGLARAHFNPATAEPVSDCRHTGPQKPLDLLLPVIDLQQESEWGPLTLH